jgi:hypothetical protein
MYRTAGHGTRCLMIRSRIGISTADRTMKTAKIGLTGPALPKATSPGASVSGRRVIQRNRPRHIADS